MGPPLRLLLPLALATCAVAAEPATATAAAAAEAAAAAAAALAADEDDACAAGGDADCSLSLRQLRGEERTAEAQAHGEAHGDAQGVDDRQHGEASAEGGEQVADDFPGEPGEHGDELFLTTDADGDGEVQHHEALSLLGRLGDYSEEQKKALFEAQDTDSSQGLSHEEFATAMEKWGGGCAAAHRSFFCSGSTGITCCRHGLVWRQCGSAYHHRGCFGGHYGGAGYHYHGPYRSGGHYHYHRHGPWGGYHAGGGGYHRGPWGGGGYHYHRHGWR